MIKQIKKLTVYFSQKSPDQLQQRTKLLEALQLDHPLAQACVHEKMYRYN